MFDKTEIYKKEVERFARFLMLACNKAQIPLFISMAVSDDGNKTEYKNLILSSKRLGVDLSQDHIYDHVKIMNGFVTTLPPYASGSDDDEYDISEYETPLEEAGEITKDNND